MPVASLWHGHWENDPHTGALRARGNHVSGASGGDGDVADKGQPDAETALLLAHALMGCPGESVEDPVPVNAGDARACISHGNDGLAAGNVGGNRYLAACRSMDKGVLRQTQDCTVKPLRRNDR